MKTLKEQFESTLALWAAAHALPAEEAKLDGDGELTLTVSETVGTLVYREATDMVIYWMECGEAVASGIERETLRENDRFARTQGFTVSVDAKTHRVVVHDRRPAERFTSAEILEAWLQAGARLSADLRLVAQYGRDAAPREC